MTRRDFLKLGSSAVVLTAAGCRSVFGRRTHDENLTVFISDVHAKPDTYQLGRFERVIDEIAVEPNRERRAGRRVLRRRESERARQEGAGGRQVEPHRQRVAGLRERVRH